MSIPTGKDLLAILPQLIVCVMGMVMLMLDAFAPRLSRRILATLSVLGFLGAGVAVWMLWPHKGTPPVAMQGMILADGLAGFFNIVICLGAGVAVLFSVNYWEAEGRGGGGEYYALLMFTVMGAMVMTTSINLICIFLGLEILSIALYVLAGYQTEKNESDEAAMKYFLLGAFASAFFLYGIALIYGATGSLNVTEITDRLNLAPVQGLDVGKNFLLLGGIAMMVVGFGFKVAIVPFHVWTPDVYEGAPTVVTAFMSVVAKTAGFAAFLRVIASGFQDPALQMQISAVLASVAALTMLVGNVVAVVQPTLKRMLAYSSIAHAGYILCGLVAAVRPAAPGMGSPAQEQAISAVLFYTLAYAVANLGAFGVVMALRRRGEEVQQISDLAGVGYRYPLLGALMSLFLLSLAGLPPLAGFLGKLFIIQSLVHMQPPLYWLILMFALTSVVSFYYYLGPIRAMYLDKSDEGADVGEEAVRTSGGVVMQIDWHHRAGLALCAVLTILFGVWSSGAFGVAVKVAEAFLASGSPFSAMR